MNFLKEFREKAGCLVKGEVLDREYSQIIIDEGEKISIYG